MGNQVEKLKGRTTPYPAVFKDAIIKRFLWEAGFSLENGRKGINKSDFAYISGCCFRSVACLNQVLFAVNESYLMNEKGASAIADSFAIVPKNYSHRVNDVFTLITDNPDNLEAAFSLLRKLIGEIDLFIK